MQICHKEITVVYFHPLFASHPFTLLHLSMAPSRGGSRILIKGGGHKTLLIFLTAAPAVAQVPKKALISGGGGGGVDYDPFFRSATSVESRASPKRGGGDPTHFCVPKHFVYVSKGGGAIVQNNFKGGGGTGRVCRAPPP